ncbi:MAG: SCO family protein [Acidobacteria bacterium]|nr:SCO family protein [Acidobacteriota bacterium]
MTCALCLGGEAAGQPGFPSGYGNRQAPGTVSTEVPAQLREVTFKQRLNEQLPLDAAFRDESGRAVTLGELFGRRPVVLAFVYYQCPMLCSQVMNGLSSATKALPFGAGKDFEVVLISFDPRDTPEVAAAKKREHLGKWPEGDAAAWHLLTGDEATIRRVTAAAGFTYRWDERTGQFAHVSGILVATPEGRLARYFYGVEFSPKELRLALVDSGEGRVGTLVDELLLYCFHYDPESGRYGLLVMNLVRLGGVLTVLFIGAYIVVTRLREWHLPFGRP